MAVDLPVADDVTGAPDDAWLIPLFDGSTDPVTPYQQAYEDLGAPATQANLDTHIADASAHQRPFKCNQILQITEDANTWFTLCSGVADSDIVEADGALANSNFASLQTRQRVDAITGGDDGEGVGNDVAIRLNGVRLEARRTVSDERWIYIRVSEEVAQS